MSSNNPRNVLDISEESIMMNYRFGLTTNPTVMQKSFLNRSAKNIADMR